MGGGGGIMQTRNKNMFGFELAEEGGGETHKVLIIPSEWSADASKTAPLDGDSVSERDKSVRGGNGVPPNFLLRGSGDRTRRVARWKEKEQGG